MKVQKFLLLGTALLLLSGCAGVKPNFTAVNMTGYPQACTTVFKDAGRNPIQYSYVPSSGVLSYNYNSMMSQKNGKWKMSILFPPSVRLEF